MATPQELIAEFINHDEFLKTSKLFFPWDSEKKVWKRKYSSISRNICQRMHLHVDDVAEPVALFDNTRFGTADSGMLLTTSHLFFTEMDCDVGEHVSGWFELEELEFVESHSSGRKCLTLKGKGRIVSPYSSEESIHDDNGNLKHSDKTIATSIEMRRRGDRDACHDTIFIMKKWCEGCIIDEDF